MATMQSQQRSDSLMQRFISVIDRIENGPSSLPIVGTTLASIALFSLMRRYLATVLRDWLPADHRAWREPERLTRIIQYLISTLVSASISCFSFYKLWGREHLLRGNLTCISVLLGYFIHDMWMTRGTWLKYPDELIHHVAGIALLGPITVMRSIPELVPMFTVVEFSSIFLNIGWLHRELTPVPQRSLPMFKTIQVSLMRAFFLSFTTTRILWFGWRMAYLEYRIWMQSRGLEKPRLVRTISDKALGVYQGLWITRASLQTVYWLQWFWFIKMLRKLVSGRA